MEVRKQELRAGRKHLDTEGCTDSENGEKRHTDVQS